MDGGDVWGNLAARATDDAARDKTVVNRIMLRFRPIAPKPVDGSSGSGLTVGENTSKALLSGKRAKRKYVRVRRNSGSERNNNDSHDNNNNRSEVGGGHESQVVTLPLMPEKTELLGGSISGGSWCNNVDLEFKNEIPWNPETAGLWAENGGGRVVETHVTVESVGETCLNMGGLGGTDVERVGSLERDTCPGFVSDGRGEVGWVNEAYKRMVRGGNEEEEVVVRLRLNKVREKIMSSCEAFTCGVRLQYTWRKEKWTKMVPCDVWKLDSGGFAWRLDIKAALSLGL